MNTPIRRFSVALLAVLGTSYAAVGAAPAPERPAGQPWRVAAEHILFLYAEAFEPRGSTRTKEEALELARHVHEEIAGERLGFTAACEKHCEDPLARKAGGYMGIFKRHEFALDFAAVGEEIFALKIGEVSGPVESPLGIHLFRRVPIREWAGRHILVQYRGARQAPAALTRSRAEAEALARRLLDRARAAATDFGDLARRLSEAPDAVRGGDLGVFGPGEMLPALERAIESLEIGEVGGPVETPLGWHIVRRERIRRVHLAHILIRFQGTQEDQGVGLTRAEAMAKARTVLASTRATGADFAELARIHGQDGSSGREGELGFFTPGALPLALEKAAFALSVGEVSDVVESTHGFHILMRLPEE